MSSVQLGVCDWDLDTHGRRWDNDCAGDSGWETGNVHAWLQQGDCGFACTEIVQGTTVYCHILKRNT